MKEYQGMKIIGIDNGYGNIKTANCCFPAGLTAHDAEPVFKDELLVYGGRYYLIGAGHKEFTADKTGDDDYYILTLAAIARELNVHGLTGATVRLAVGLPLTWVSQQREDFKAYLMRSREVYFTFRGKVYRVEIAGADVFPQGFAAVASQIRDFQGVNMLCDIGNGTMNIMFINDRRPAADRMFTEKYGTHQCTADLCAHDRIEIRQINVSAPVLPVFPQWLHLPKLKFYILPPIRPRPPEAGNSPGGSLRSCLIGF